MEKLIESFISPKLQQGLFPGCQVLVAHKGETLVELSRGFMVEHSNAPLERVTPQTLFNIESITKVMVTLPLTLPVVCQKRIRGKCMILANYNRNFILDHV